MKRVYRERALSRLYAELQSGDFDVREYALFQLVLLLRRGQDAASAAGDFAAGEQLSRDLQRLILSPADHERIVSQLLRLAARQADSRASAFWALGEVSAKFAFSHALATIGQHGERFSDEAAFQACRVLRKWLHAEEFERRLGDELLADNRSLRWLCRWSRSTEARLATCANAVISRARELSN